MSLNKSMLDFGVVVIGRNEGDRLRRCIESVPRGVPLVYVDSGSTDGSAQWARSHGAEVIDLDVSIPFTAARARNTGYRRLREISPNLPCIQFVDGDCELRENWLQRAASFLRSHPEVGVVCGLRREVQ